MMKEDMGVMKGVMMTGEGGHMTMEQMVMVFQEDLTEEIEDCKKYLHLAESAEEMNNPDLYEGLYEIAKDEYTHAEFLYDYLTEHGMEVTEQQRLGYHEIKERIYGLFR